MTKPGNLNEEIDSEIEDHDSETNYHLMTK